MSQDIQYPSQALLKDLKEGSEFRKSFDIIQVPTDPEYYIALPGTNVAIGRVIIPKGKRKVNGNTEVKIQWFEK